MDELVEQRCQVPPEGWYCTRAAGHEGPCAAMPVADPAPVDRRADAAVTAKELSRVLIEREGDAKFGIVAFWKRHTIIAALEAYAAEPDGPPETIDGFATGSTVAPNTAEPPEVASRITFLEAQLAESHKTLRFFGKWIERGRFCKTVSPMEALGVMAHFPGMPWNSERWDVDHKSYAEAYYKEFPKTRAILSTEGRVG